MHLFYIEILDDKFGTLDEAETHHCIQVLRMRDGEELHAIDGKGNKYTGRLNGVQNNKARVLILEKLALWGEKKTKIRMGISPLKLKDNFEWFLEKSVELGIDEIVPIACKRTVQYRLPSKDRMDKILLTAMKQSKRSLLPVVQPVQSFQEFVQQEHFSLRIIMWCEANQALASLQPTIQVAETISCLIGPEGDFTTEEISQAMFNGFKPVHLQTNRLRSETAGLYVLSVLKWVQQY